MSRYELERFLIFAVCVAGKKAKTTLAAVSRLIDGRMIPHEGPFMYIRRLIATGRLGGALLQARLGNYRKTERALREITAAHIDLRTCTVEDLERIHGIGPKTSRFFVGYTRPGVRVAILDTHVLAHLRQCGHDVPRSTPQSPKRYREIEQIVLHLADHLGVGPMELDNAIWRTRSGDFETAALDEARKATT